jgi:hypothetical protein
MGLEAQRERIRSYAAEKGLELVDSDNSKSTISTSRPKSGR